MSFCLPKFAADNFRKLLKEGRINPQELAELTSTERRARFTEIIGEENARQVNALFESKLLLKNQQLGMISWAEKVAGLKPGVKRTMIEKVNRLTKVLEPEELDMFLDDLAEQKLGIDVTVEEAGRLAQLGKAVEDARTQIPEEYLSLTDEAQIDKYFSENKAIQEYGFNLADFKDYVSKLKTEAGKFTLKDYAKNPLRLVPATGNLMKSVLASFDNSFIGRQGIKALFNNPKLWTKAFVKSWQTFGKQLIAKTQGGMFSELETAPLNAIKAKIYAHPDAINGLYERSNLAIGLKTEEAFPTSFPAKIPLLGRLFSASESAYNGAALYMRARWASKYFRLAEKQGVNLNNKVEAESIGTLVNSLTGRGKIAASSKGLDVTNALFFSPRFIKSNLDLFTQPFGGDKLSTFARKQAGVNLARTAAGVAGTLFLAKMLGFDIDLKKKLGQIGFNGNWVDITGGNRAFAQLGINIYNKLSQKSYKYGEKTAVDVVEDFLEGKLAPLPSILRDIGEKRHYDGTKPTIKSVFEKGFTPIPIQSLDKLSADELSDLIFGALELQGFSTQLKK